MKQVLFIHGGMTFVSKEEYIKFLKSRQLSLDYGSRWSGEYLKKSLDEFQVITPRMPNKDYSQYEEWKIHFERYMELVGNKIILIGESLGGIFLVKYFSENKINKHIVKLILVAPPFDDTLHGERLAGGFLLQEDLSLIKEQVKNITFMFSEDDDVVPLSHMKKYKEKLPNANFMVLQGKNGHFNVEEFPEIISIIKE